MMFSGIFNDLDPHEIAALLSCVVHDENSADSNVNIKNEKLSKAYATMMEQAKRIVKVYQEAKINIDEVKTKK